MSVEAPAISAIGSAIESGITHSAIPAMSSVGIGGTFEGHFSPSYLTSLPEHTINSASLNTNRAVPVPEMVFNQKLFEVVYQAQEKTSGVALPDFLGLPEYRIDPESFAAKTELTPVSVKLIWEQEDMFPIIWSAPKPKPEVSSGILPPAEQPVLHAEGQVEPAVIEGSPSIFHAPNTEFDADSLLVEGVKTQLQDQSVWSPEEKTFWENLFDRTITAGTKTETSIQTSTETPTGVSEITQPQMGTEVQCEPKAETEVVSELQLMEQADILPPNITAIGQETPEEKQPQKDPVWEIYQISSTWDTAQKELEDRLETAQDITREAFQTGDPLETMTEMAYRLDKPGIDTTLKISAGKLIYPQIANRVHDLEEDSDPMQITPEGIAQALEDIVVENKPDEQKVKVNHVTTVEQGALVPQARKLAEEGAQHIVEKDGQMKAVSMSPRQFPQEMDKTERS